MPFDIEEGLNSSGFVQTDGFSGSKRTVFSSGTMRQTPILLSKDRVTEAPPKCLLESSETQRTQGNSYLPQTVFEDLTAIVRKSTSSRLRHNDRIFGGVERIFAELPHGVNVLQLQLGDTQLSRPLSWSLLTLVAVHVVH